MKVLVCSPHMDDAYLSLGGSIARWSGEGHSVTVLDVFGNDPATKNNQGSLVSRVATRSREEAANSALTLTDLTIWRLTAGWPGRGYSDWYAERFLPSDGSLIEQLRDRLAGFVRGCSPDLVMAPASIGGHVDHRMVRMVTLEVVQREEAVGLYEDLPYAVDSKCWGSPGPLFDDGWTPYRLSIENTIDVKKRLLETYESQLTETEVRLVLDYARDPAQFLPVWASSHVVGERDATHASERAWLHRPELWRERHQNVIRELGLERAK